ncbi:MAG TPA: dTDP-4-dehydrorhamnose reductase [Sphingomicrobium sp.]
MKLLVTGKNGQLAQSLTEHAALWPGIELIAVGRPDIDLESPGSASELIRRLKPDLVINAAADTDVDGAEEQPLRARRINGEAAGEVAAAAAAIGSPIIHISTDYVFDGSSIEPYSEEEPTRPINAYGCSKLAGEEAVQAANPRHLILRTAWLYSPFGRNFVKTIFEAAGERDELRVVADSRGSPTSALDLAGALLKIAECWPGTTGREQGAVYHLAGSGEASWYELACEIMTCRARLGLPTARVIPIAGSDWPRRAARPSFSVLSNSKFIGDFGFGLPPWQCSVAEVVDRIFEPVG